MKIICIGRNYAEHAKEMNSSLPTKPIFFLKPDTALFKDNNPFYIPDFTSEMHYECELVVRINKVGKNIQEKFAQKYYNEIGLGLDFTARDLQQNCKEKGLPWEIAKGFDNSALISNKFIKIDHDKINDLNFKLDLNGQTVQEGNPNQMIFTIDQIIAYISQFITLKTGDLIFTGTPSGVGSISIGDELKGFIKGEEFFNLEIK
ncbi:MAG: fumarylacetoacetate hydrolase family protein [Crocinitomicaceae bacterium]